MASSASAELDLERTTFVLSPEERALGSSLENDLHPVYRRSNFKASALVDETTGEEVGEPILEARVHERMLPALRLASLLLDFSLPFYAKVFCADLVLSGDEFAFDPSYQPTDADIERVRGLLVEWSGRTRFYCDTPDPPVAPNLQVDAFSEIRTAGGPLPAPARSLICISTRTVGFFGQEAYAGAAAAAKTARLVQLAFVLAHEQAHAVFSHRWAEDPGLAPAARDFISRVAPREPVYHAHVDPRYYELGFALQAWLHGGSVFCHEGALDGGQELLFVRYPGDVLGEATSVMRYNWRAALLSAALWRAVRAAPRPSSSWNAVTVPYGWLGQAIAEHMGE